MLLEKLGKGERGFEVQGGVTSCLGFMGVSKMGNVMLETLVLLLLQWVHWGAWFEEGYNVLKNDERQVYMLVDVVNGDVSSE